MRVHSAFYWALERGRLDFPRGGGIFLQSGCTVYCLSNAPRPMRTEVSELSGSTPGRNATKIFQQPMHQRYLVAYDTNKGTLDDTPLSVDRGPTSFGVGRGGLRAPRRIRLGRGRASARREKVRDTWTKGAKGGAPE